MAKFNVPLQSDPIRYQSQLEKLFGFVMAEFSDCENFLITYYASGSSVSNFLQGLANVWNNLLPTVLSSSNNLVHITQLVGGLTEYSLKSLSKDFEEFPTFVSDNLSEILISSPELAPRRFICLNFDVKDFEAIREHSDIVNIMFEDGLFELTLANLEFSYQFILGKTDLKSLRLRNFTTIRSTENNVLLDKVERNFDSYLRNILLSIPSNTEEDTSAILDVIHHEEIDSTTIKEFLEQQSQQLSTLESVPDRLHSMIFNLIMIVPSWENCLAFMESKGFEEDSLVRYLDNDVVCSAILKQPIPRDSDSLKLRHFLIKTNSLSDSNYRKYVRALPMFFRTFPDGLKPVKLKIIIEERKIEFTDDNLGELAEYRDLQLLFLSTNIDTYLAEQDNFSLDDDFRIDLLQTDISHINKLKIVESMDLHSVIDTPERIALVGAIIANSDVNLPNIDGDIASALIRNSSPVATQILLFNKYHTHLSDYGVRDVLMNLPKPYSEITSGYHTPRLKDTPENQVLLSWLDSRKFISSWKISEVFKEIKVNLYRS